MIGKSSEKATGHKKAILSCNSISQFVFNLRVAKLNNMSNPIPKWLEVLDISSKFQKFIAIIPN